jgi:hypothetical protein
MLKMTCPTYCANQQYNGLHEFLKWTRQKRHRPFHSRPWHFWSPHCRRRFDCSENVNTDINNNVQPPIVENSRISGVLVNDVTLPDKNYCPVDTVMTKTWRIRNDGNLDWGNNVELVFVKGDECLVLEKRYPVSNAKPNEEVDVSAVLKTPLKSGEYSAIFGLKANNVFFGPQLKVELFAVEENDDEIVLDAELPEQYGICVCGEKLIGIPARQAYNGSRVSCNICEKKCTLEEVIYHCPRNQNAAHFTGYDICSNCIAIQLQSMIPSSDDKNADKDEQKNDKENNHHVENENKNDDFVPVSPVNLVNINGIVDNSQGGNVSPKNSEPELIEMEDVSDNEKENQDNFEFKLQLNSLKEMGFNDVQTLKFLLTKHAGDVQRVIQELIQA